MDQIHKGRPNPQGTARQWALASRVFVVAPRRDDKMLLGEVIWE